MLRFWAQIAKISIRRKYPLYGISSNSAEMGTCLKYGYLIYDVIMDLFGIIFMNFYNQQNCMVIGLNLMYTFNLSQLHPNLSRSKKLLHVFWNTLYL